MRVRTYQLTVVVAVLLSLTTLARQAPPPAQPPGPAAPTDPPAPFYGHIVATGLRGGYQVVATDVNKDGKVDLIALGAQMTELLWYENPYWTPHVITREAPRMINMAAGSAFIRNHGVYGLAKGAVILLTEALALELGPQITVNAVAPGQIAESGPDISAIDPTFVDRAIRHTPAGRLVTRQEVANLIAWLCSPAADLITGHTIPVDGGWRFNRF